jgi:soluble lytic murein transglycosylase-like protein
MTVKKRLIKYILLMCLLLTPPQSLSAVPLPVELTIEQKIDHYAEKHGVSSSLMHHIVSKESSYNPNALGDTGYTCRRTGKIAPSRGLVQINECWWPEEYKQAGDPDFALNFLASKLSEGKCYLWSTCPANHK